MSQPVKLSDSLILDARMAGGLLERSIAGQVEFWARLGRAIEPMLDGDHVLALCRSGAARSLAECIETVDSSEGRRRLSAYLADTPFPHFEPHPLRKGVLIRIEEDGTRIAGRFVNRKFRPSPVAKKRDRSAV